jgi:hypothetical protein
MGLGQLAKPKELWTIVKGKDGKEYPNILRCTDFDLLDEQEPELSKLLTDKYNEWVFQVGADDAEKKLADWSGKDGGYQIKQGEVTYKFIRGKDGNLQLSKMLPYKGGFRKGGGYGAVPMRTTVVKVGPIDVVSQTISNQSDTDNWEVKYIKSDNTGDFFLMENKQPYTPKSATPAAAEKKEEESDE